MKYEPEKALRAIQKVKWDTPANKQMTLPAGWLADGSRWASLEEVLSRDVRTIEFSELTRRQRAEITAIRIGKQLKYRKAILRLREINRDQAIREVENLTPIGLALINVEERLIRFVEEHYRSTGGADPISNGH